MHIQMIISDLGPGGAQVTVKNLAKALSNEGIKVSLVTLHKPWVSKESHINYEIIQSSKSRTLTSIPFLIKNLRQKSPDIVISHLPQVNFAIGLLHLLPFVTKFKHLPVIHHIPNYQGKNEKYWDTFVHKCAHYFCSKANHLICVSTAAKQNFLKIYPKTKITVIGNPINENLINSNPSAQYKNQIKPPLQLLYCGRLVPEKGLITLVDAIKLLQQHQNSHLTILGKGPMKKTLEQYIEQLGLLNHITISSCAHNEITWYYEQCDITILPSPKEAFGNVVIESLARNKPVIVCKHSGGPEKMIKSGITGETFKPDSASNLVTKILKATKTQYDHNAMQKIALQFNPAIIAQQYLKLFQKILNY